MATSKLERNWPLFVAEVASMGMPQKEHFMFAVAFGLVQPVEGSRVGSRSKNMLNEVQPLIESHWAEHCDGE